MRRRRFLALIAASPLFAGCNSTPSSRTADKPSRTPEETSDQTTTTPGAEPTTPTTVSDSLLRERDPPSPDLHRTVDRPRAVEPPNATDETVPPLSYPDKPAAYTTETVAEFVEAYEQARTRNNALKLHGNAVISQEFYPEWTHTLATAETAGVGRIQYANSARVIGDDEGEINNVDSGVLVATYYVNESIVVRAAAPGLAEHKDVLEPDPWASGVILEPVSSHET